MFNTRKSLKIFYSHFLWGTFKGKTAFFRCFKLKKAVFRGDHKYKLVHFICIFLNSLVVFAQPYPLCLINTKKHPLTLPPPNY
jgi:hypothetical protein